MHRIAVPGLGGRSPWRSVAIVAAGLAVLLVVVAGRHESRNATATQLRGIESVRARVGPDILGPKLRGVARVGVLKCLLFAEGDYAFALELCINGDGRLVRAVDATGSAEERIWDISGSPASGPVLLEAGHLDDPSRTLDRRQALFDVVDIPRSRVTSCFAAMGGLFDGSVSRRDAPSVVTSCAHALELTVEGASVAAKLGDARIAGLIPLLLPSLREEIVVARGVAAAATSGPGSATSVWVTRHRAARAAYARAFAPIAQARAELGAVG